MNFSEPLLGRSPGGTALPAPTQCFYYIGGMTRERTQVTEHCDRGSGSDPRGNWVATALGSLLHHRGIFRLGPFQDWEIGIGSSPEFEKASILTLRKRYITGECMRVG